MNQLPLKSLALYVLFLAFLAANLSAQTNISGTINSYFEVISVDATNACVTVDPGTPTGLNLNDRVLLIQMQGATMDETNSTSFGTVSLLNGTGSYEVGVVCTVTGNTICFQYDLVNSYNPFIASDAKIQLIPIPSYTGDVDITGTLTGQPWDGDVGGVLVFEATGTVTLNADINMDGMGFRGGLNIQSAYDCTGAFGVPKAPQTAYFYDIADVDGEKGAWKGEGIVAYRAGKELGKGAQANGGGGGNDHNSGGGGGANYGSGGQGGTRANIGVLDCAGDHPGSPGYLLSGLGYTLGNNSIFMGGGGGSGHDNNGEGQDGGNGGGIIIITANQIDGNGFAITANGDDAIASGSDGAPGGGAGGAILLNANSFSANPLTIEATGGDGAISTTVGTDCMGPGGGGGGGVIWTFGAVGGGTTTNVAGGANGTVASGAAFTASCPGNTNGASSGLSGVVQTGLDIPEESIISSPCVLSASDLQLQAVALDNRIRLEWQVEETSEFQQFRVQRQYPNGHFESLYTIPVPQPHSGVEHFRWTDFPPFTGEIRYRLEITDRQGSIRYSRLVSTFIDPAELGASISVFPNPLRTQPELTVEVFTPLAAEVQVSIQSLSGQTVLKSPPLQVEAGNRLVRLPVSGLPAGMYLVSAQIGNRTYTRKWVKQ